MSGGCTGRRIPEALVDWVVIGDSEETNSIALAIKAELANHRARLSQ
jgi:hypothetical protein